MRSERSLVRLALERAERDPDALAYASLDVARVAPGRLPVLESLTALGLVRRAGGLARVLADRSRPGDPVLLAYPLGPTWVAAFLGARMAGLVPVPLPVPRGGKSAEGWNRLFRVAEDCEARLFLGPTSLVSELSRLVQGEGLELIDPAGCGEDPSPSPRSRDSGAGLAWLQYTSGSTGAPRAVEIEEPAILANLAQIQERFLGDEPGPTVSWVPPFHDMGLVGGLLMPLWLGQPCHTMPGEKFLARPEAWIQALGATGSHYATAPDSAWRLVADRVRPEHLEGVDLSRMLSAVNGAEPIRAETLERLAAALAPAGFGPGVPAASYGMAEASLLVSSRPLGSISEVVRFDAGDLSRGRARPDPGGVPLVSCGTPAEGMEIRIVDPETREVLGEGRIGEVWLAGPNVNRAYWGAPEETGYFFRARTADGAGPYLRTGDLGFSWQGHLYITGRTKDLVIVAGRKIHSADLEASAESAHPGVRPHGTVAFGIDLDGREQVVVAVSRAAQDETPAGELLRAVRDRVGRDHEVPVHEVVLVRPAALPRTTSGKLRRSEFRAAWSAGEVKVEARSGDSPGAAPGGDLGEDGALGPLVEAVSALWERVLGAPPEGPDADFFGAGGDSLLATRLALDLEEALGQAPKLEELLAEPTPRGIARRLLSGPAASTAPRAGSKAGPSSRRAPGPGEAEDLEILREFARDPISVVRDLERRFGNLVRFRVGPVVCHLMTAPHHFVHVFQEHQGQYRKQAGNWQRARTIIGEGPLTAEGGLWGKQRRALNPFFAPGAVEAHAAVVQARAAAWVRDLRSRMGEAELDLQEETSRFMLRLGLELLFEVEPDDSVAALSHWFSVGYAHTGFLVPDVDERGLPSESGMLAEREAARREIRPRIQAILERPSIHDRSRRSRIAEALGEPGNERALDGGTTLIFGSSETVGTALSWALLRMGEVPGLSERVARDPDLALRVAAEAFRLYPTGWLTPRHTERPDEVDGYEIPARSRVLLSSFLLHRNPGYWPDPERFDPDRHLPEVAAARPPGVHLPFGIGPRACIAREYSDLVVAGALGAFASELRVEPTRPVVPEGAVAVRARGGLWVRLVEAAASPS